MVRLLRCTIAVKWKNEKRYLTAKIYLTLSYIWNKILLSQSYSKNYHMSNKSNTTVIKFFCSIIMCTYIKFNLKIVIKFQHGITYAVMKVILIKWNANFMNSILLNALKYAKLTFDMHKKVWSASMEKFPDRLRH